MRQKLSLVVACLGLSLSFRAAAGETDWSAVDTALGRSAAVSANVHRYGLPRSDLKVTVDGVALKPTFALGGWLAFMPMGDKAIMMGDLVLTESEINPVMSKLLAEGVEVTAVHNHLGEPRSAVSRSKAARSSGWSSSGVSRVRSFAFFQASSALLRQAGRPCREPCK